METEQIRRKTGRNKQGNKQEKGKKNDRKTERTEKQDVTIMWQPR